MTLPYERTYAVLNTQEFLRSLLDPKRTPGVPKVIRERAASLLKHYPSKYDMEIVVEEGSSRFGDDQNLYGTKNLP
jgi:hypothetical protein